VKKPWLPWLLLALALGMGIYLVAQDKAQAKILAAQLKNEKAQNAILADKVTAAAEKSAVAEQRMSRLETQAAKRESILLAELSRVKIATPQQLVDDGSRLLRATDIFISTDGKAIHVGLETWRRAVSLMILGDEYVNTAKPAWAAQVKAWGETSAALHGEIDANKEQVVGLEGTVKDLSKSLAIQKRASTLEKIAWGAVGMGAGIVIDKVLK